MIEKLDGFRMPAEWEPQKSIWIAWPYNKKDWPDLFYFIPEVVAKIVKAISENQKVNLLINIPRTIWESTGTIWEKFLTTQQKLAYFIMNLRDLISA